MTVSRRKKVFEITNGRCFYCGCELEFDNFHADHFHPKSFGGKAKDNLVPSCPDCNMSKGNLSIEQFGKKISDLPKRDATGRMISKYYDISPKRIEFYFEVNDYGSI